MSNPMTNAALVESINKSFNKQFPNGWSSIRETNSAFGGTHIQVVFGLVDKSELTSRILENDPVFHSIYISIDGDDYYVADRLQGCIKVNPVNKMYAMDSIKTKFRKTKGDSKKLSKTFNTFFERLNVLVSEHESNIYQRKNYSDIYFNVGN